MKKDLSIHAIRVVEVDDSKNIPSVVSYANNAQPLIGSAAIRLARSRRELIEDFKIDLGTIDAATGTSSQPKRGFRTPGGERKSALGVTSDFFREVLKSVNAWLASHDVDKGTSILLAEPLAIQAQPDWLSNYRQNIKRILDRKMVGEEFAHIDLKDIDFLPEPFAVFQYYRYGYRHPLLAERTKQHALVIDFGGGTFDVCIIETTKEGDISKSGKNSKPLAASSEPVGGFFFNRAIVAELYRKNLITKSDSGKFNKAMDAYKKWRNNELDLGTAGEEYRNFIDNFHRSSYAIEDTKLSLCKNIANWDLEAPLTLPITVSLPKNPFSASEDAVTVRMTAAELRDIFVRAVWDQRLKLSISLALQRGRQELRGASISVVLLSGGSANIGWLAQLLKRDFGVQLADAEVLHLPDFQEVVAKGLAVECARRFYVEDGDFSSVTYNTLCLILDVSDSGPEVRPFRARTPGLPAVQEIPGVLLPSASFLREYIDKPMRWRVDTGRVPRKLGYYFLKSSFDPEDLPNLQNVEERTIFAPADCAFDSNLSIELTVKQDSTAIPRFVFKSGRDDSEATAKTGKPFYLDMTYGQSIRGSKAYIGFDFGTSNSSVSFVDAASIKMYQRRSTENTWLELSDLSAVLPHPLATPLASYLSESGSEELLKRGREYIESALAMAAFVTYIEFCTKKGRRSTALFKGFTQRSAGPLWKLLRDCLDQLRGEATISAAYKELFDGEIYETVNEAVTFVSQEKHDKVSGSTVDLVRPIQILANVSHKIFSKALFGSFEQIKRQRYAATPSFQGLFRVMAGSPPFVRALEYEGKEAFPEQVPFLLFPAEGTAIPLDPLIFWDHCQKHPDLDGHCFIYDIYDRDRAAFSYKAVAYKCSCLVSPDGAYDGLAKRLIDMRIEDRHIETLPMGEIRYRDD